MSRVGAGQATALAARARFSREALYGKSDGTGSVADGAGSTHCCHARITSLPAFATALRQNHGTSCDASAARNSKWGYVEWTHQLNRLTREQIAEVTKGTPRDWLRQTAADCHVIYDWAKPGQKFEKFSQYRAFMNKAVPLAESQIQKAGYRLAKVLNMSFVE